MYLQKQNKADERETKGTSCCVSPRGVEAFRFWSLSDDDGDRICCLPLFICFCGLAQYFSDTSWRHDVGGGSIVFTGVNGGI